MEAAPPRPPPPRRPTPTRRPRSPTRRPAPRSSSRLPVRPSRPLCPSPAPRSPPCLSCPPRRPSSATLTRIRMGPLDGYVQRWSAASPTDQLARRLQTTKQRGRRLLFLHYKRNRKKVGRKGYQGERSPQSILLSLILLSDCHSVHSPGIGRRSEGRDIKVDPAASGAGIGPVVRTCRRTWCCYRKLDCRTCSAGCIFREDTKPYISNKLGSSSNQGTLETTTSSPVGGCCQFIIHSLLPEISNKLTRGTVNLGTTEKISCRR